MRLFTVPLVFAVFLLSLGFAKATDPEVYGPYLLKPAKRIVSINSRFLENESHKKVYIPPIKVDDYQNVVDDYSTAFTTVFCMSLWSQAIEKVLNADIKDKWANRRPLYINTRNISFVENAYYNSQNSSLNFNYNPHTKVATCRSFETVSHETGHAFLDAIFPELNASESIYASAFHEAVGDITAVLAVMRIGISNGETDKVKNALLTLEITKMVSSNGFCIRAPHAFVGFASYECHCLSEPFTKFFFDLMRYSYNKVKEAAPGKDDALIVRELSLAYRVEFLNAILSSIPQDNNYHNSFLINIGENLSSSLFKKGLLNNIDLINQYAEKLSQSIDIPNADINLIKIPVAYNSFKCNYAPSEL